MSNLSNLSTPAEQYRVVRQAFADKLGFTLEPWRFPLWQVRNRPEYFAYKAGNGADGICLIERIDVPDGRVVVVCIETAGNPGQSVSNCVEELCFQVCERFEIAPDRMVWLEHHDGLEPQTWSMVTFGRRPPNGPFEDPKWREMTPEMWQGLRLQPRKQLEVDPLEPNEFKSKVRKLFESPTEAIDET